MIVQEQPLVSIIVITYNSSKYVVETLESAKTQSYQNIELIISDDGSSDDTVSICEKWLSMNKERFVYSTLLTVKKNTGTSANCNRGVLASKGKWLKLIGGDDILMMDAISSFIEFTDLCNCSFVVSDVEYFNDRDDLSTFGNKNELQRFFSKKSVLEKYKSYVRSSFFLLTPSFFYSREVYDLNKGFDEDIILLEDKPFVINTLKNNVNIVYFNKKTVRYRVFHSDRSLSRTQVLNDHIRCNEKYIFPVLRKGSLKDRLFYLILRWSYNERIANHGQIKFKEKVLNKIFQFIKYYC